MLNRILIPKAPLQQFFLLDLKLEPLFLKQYVVYGLYYSDSFCC